jgi:hypothetical protein
MTSPGPHTGQIPVVSAGPLPVGQPPMMNAVPPPPRKRRTALIVGVLVGVILLVAAAVGAAYLFVGRDDQFSVGSCVTRDGDRAEPASCSDPDAYRITKRVSDPAQCPPGTPIVDLQGADGLLIRCLAPAEG